MTDCFTYWLFEWLSVTWNGKFCCSKIMKAELNTHSRQTNQFSNSLCRHSSVCHWIHLPKGFTSSINMSVSFFVFLYFSGDHIYLLPPPRFAQRSGDSITSQWVSFCRKVAVHTWSILSECVVYLKLIVLRVCNLFLKSENPNCERSLLTNNL